MFTLQTIGRNADFTRGALGIRWRVSGWGREHDQVCDFRESLWLPCGKQSADTRVRGEEPVTWLVVEERWSPRQSRQRWRWSRVSDSGYILEGPLSALTDALDVRGWRKDQEQCPGFGPEPQDRAEGLGEVVWPPGKLVAEPRPENPSIQKSLGLVPLPHHLPPALKITSAPSPAAWPPRSLKRPLHEAAALDPRA